MKKAVKLFAGLICFLILTNCRKTGDEAAMANAILTGYDIRDCACCGGLMVTFSNDTTRYSGAYYLVDKLPDNSGIDNNTKFPLYVKITWKYSSNVCGGTKFIDILKLEIK